MKSLILLIGLIGFAAAVSFVDVSKEEWSSFKVSIFSIVAYSSFLRCSFRASNLPKQPFIAFQFFLLPNSALCYFWS